MTGVAEDRRSIEAGPAFRLGAPSPLDLARRSAELAAALPTAALPLLRGGSPRQVTRREIGRAIRVVAQRLGGTWVKLGQVLASTPDLVGADLAEELRPLLDTSPPVSLGRVEASLARALGCPPAQVFSELDPRPFGTGSLAVVHRAVTSDGQLVAVKVLRPGIERSSAADFVLIGRLLDRFAAVRKAPRQPFRIILAGLREQLTEELDLRQEADYMRRFRRLFASAGLDRIVVPGVLDGLSTRRVLTMEFVDGVAIDDLSAIEALGSDPVPLVEEAVRAWWATVGIEGVFHGDVHAGNLMFTTDGRLAMIDWGIVGTLGTENRRFIRSLLEAAAGDAGAWDDAARTLAAGIPERVRRSPDYDEPRVLGMIKQGLAYALTRPYGEVSLGALLSGEAFGVDADDVRARRAERRARRHQQAAEGGRADEGSRRTGSDAAGPEPSTTDDEPQAIDRDIMLLGKQLLYFERYGKRYLGHRSVLDDARFVLDLVRASEQQPA
ncbi:MAG TPA: AarF/ABC1/UbiB kinase family protein [Acidimicrobiales bacterium]|nr:AarF/ABC1/UbiB kinase family protein [Acidimicrobiales bacterium]